MARRLILYLTLVVAVVGFVFLRQQTRSAAGAQSANSIPTIAEALAHPHFQNATLTPDRRFLDAVMDVRVIVAGARDSATAVRTGDRWIVRCGGRTVGTLGAYPTFSELRTTLSDWAVALGARDSFAPAAGTSESRAGLAAAAHELSALHALRAADRVDAAWRAGARDADAATLGARALGWLAAECLDAIGAGDAVVARALAWNAVAGALDSTALERETTLLAAVMGYRAEAFDRASRLESNDPIRLYVRREDRALRGRAAAAGSSAESRWLEVRRCVETHDLESWRAAARGFDGDSLLALPLFTSGVALGRFESNGIAAVSGLQAVAWDLHISRRVFPADLEKSDRPIGLIMDTFEEVLASSPQSADGAFLDRDLMIAWYRASFYSSLYRMGEHLRLELSDLDGTVAMARQMGEVTDTQGAATEFRRWFTHLANLKRGQKPGSELKTDLLKTKSFGAGLALATYDAIHESTPAGTLYPMQCARYLQKTLDTRPDQLARWGEIAWSDLGDLAAAEPVCEAAVRASHPLDFEQRAWWASYNGDRATLDSLIEEPVDDPWQTVVALEYLRLTAPEESLRVDARYERLIASRPDDWRVIRPYVLGLRDRHLNTRARAAIRAWLGRPHRSEGAFDEVMARISYARSCLEDHLDHEGYEMIEPAVPSFQGSALATAVDLLDRLGRGGDAETLAVIAWQRYPDSPEAQVQAVDMLWRRGHGDVAAWMLKHAPQALRPDEWRRLLGPRYVSLAREQPSAARAAVAALVGMQLDDWPRLGGLVAALADSGRHEDAVSLMGRVRSGPLEDIAVESDRQEALAKIMFAYRNVKAARGTAAAADWLTAHLPDRSERTIPFLHYFAFINRDDEALWILPLVGDEFSRESLWLLRVAAMARDSAGTPAQRQELRARFATPSSNRYRHFARLLLGLESADDILSLPGEGKTPGEAFYYIALAAQARGDYHRAAVWYERCIDQNLWNNGEHHWALDQLSRWVGRNRSLERIAEADGWKGPSAPNGGPVAAVAR